MGRSGGGSSGEERGNCEGERGREEERAEL